MNPVTWFQEMMKWHPALLGAMTYAAANVIITSMPSPDDKSSKGYVWLFNTLHGLILAIPRIVAQYKSVTESPK